MPGILYDGSPLVWSPLSPPALHLLNLLENHPTRFEAILALPGNTIHSLPDEIDIHFRNCVSSHDLVWHQRIIPSLARKHSAKLIHLTSGTPSLLSSFKYLKSIDAPHFSRNPERTSFVQLSLKERWRRSIAAGGSTRVSWLLIPDYLHQSTLTAKTLNTGFSVHPSFFWEAKPKIGINNLRPEGIFTSYVLYHGKINPRSIQRLVNIWNVVSNVVGPDQRLIVIGYGSDNERQLIDALRLETPSSMDFLLPASLKELTALYSSCRALLHPIGSAPWGGAVGNALINSKPVIALENRISDAIAGPAAYLVQESTQPSEAERSLAAGLITVLIEDDFASALAQKAAHRSKNWKHVDFKSALCSIYRQLMEL
jgi:hypothetical protein